MGRVLNGHTGAIHFPHRRRRVGRRTGNGGRFGGLSDVQEPAGVLARPLLRAWGYRVLRLSGAAFLKEEEGSRVVPESLGFRRVWGGAAGEGRVPRSRAGGADLEEMRRPPQGPPPLLRGRPRAAPAGAGGECLHLRAAERGTLSTSSESP